MGLTAPNATPQVELLYRDIKIMFDETNRLRTYEVIVNEITKLINQSSEDLTIFEGIKKIINEKGLNG
jgi:hypothetical protein